jgi:hypothetical protein
MNFKERSYVDAQSLKNKGRWNENQVEQPFLNNFNPITMLYDMGAGLGEAPLMSDVTNSYMPYVTGVAAPLVTGALAGISGNTTGRFVNELVNPLAGTENLAKGLYNKSVTSLKNTAPLKKVYNNFTNRFNNRLESIQIIKNKLPKFLDPQHHIDAQKSLNEANQWMDNWYNHPALLERIDNIKKAKSKNLMFSFGEDAMLKRIKDKNYVSEFESNLNKIYDFVAGRKRVHPTNNFGTSAYSLDLFKDLNKRQNLVSKYIDPSKIKTTAIHEGTHGFTDGNVLIDDYKNMLQKPFDLTDYSPRLSDGTYKRHDDYLLEPAEIYARINEIRYENNIKPDEIITPEKVNEIIKKGRYGNSDVDFSFYDLIKDKNMFKHLLNHLPVVIPVAAGVEALNQKQEGGAIITDRGQWDYPGQTTIIPSNEITMEGVPYPVLGVDDTGYTQMMQPQMNYTFPGQYVTEYPMAQNGKEVKKNNIRQAYTDAYNNYNNRTFPAETLPIRQKAFRTVSPSSYLDFQNYNRWNRNEQRDVFYDPRSEEAWNFYLGLSKPEDLKYIKKSQYRPTINAVDQNYYTLDPELEQDIFNTFKDEVSLNKILQTDEGKVNTRLSGKGGAGALGNFGVSKGHDEKGDYLAYYDRYDLKDFAQDESKGMPYSIYNRIYYPKKQYGGQNTDWEIIG